MRLLHRYKWELAPLLIVLAASWGNPWRFQETSFSNPWPLLLHIATLTALATGLFYAFRLGRPLLTALWAYSLWRAGIVLAVWIANSILGESYQPVLVTYLLVLPATIVFVAVLAAKLAHISPSHAFMMAAVYLAITSTSAPLIGWNSPLALVLPASAMIPHYIAAALHVAALLVAAVAVRESDEAVPHHRFRWFLALIALPLATAIFKGLAPTSYPAWVRYAEAIPQPAASLLQYLIMAAVLFTIVWLLTRQPRRSNHAGVTA